MENKYIKAYNSIITSKDIDLYESFLLCFYINKHILNDGIVYTSEKKEEEMLKIERHAIGKKRKHLEELGYIKCEKNKGKCTRIIINPNLIKYLNDEKEDM